MISNHVLFWYMIEIMCFCWYMISKHVHFFVHGFKSCAFFVHDFEALLASEMAWQACELYLKWFQILIQVGLTNLLCCNITNQSRHYESPSPVSPKFLLSLFLHEAFFHSDLIEHCLVAKLLLCSCFAFSDAILSALLLYLEKVSDIWCYGYTKSMEQPSEVLENTKGSDANRNSNPVVQRVRAPITFVHWSQPGDSIVEQLIALGIHRMRNLP
jgi:hypothetical protein